jgi:hypothetical protein
VVVSKIIKWKELAVLSVPARAIFFYKGCHLKASTVNLTSIRVTSSSCFSRFPIIIEVWSRQATAKLAESNEGLTLIKLQLSSVFIVTYAWDSVRV